MPQERAGRRSKADGGSQPRAFRGRIWVINTLRAIHLAGVVGVGSGVLTGASPASWHGSAVALLASGLAIVALDGWSNPVYFRQVSTLFVALKLVLAGLLVALPGHPVTLFWAILVVSVLSAHAPSRIRHRRWW